MRERFSLPKRYTKSFERWEIDEGMREYLSSPRSKEGLHPELIDSFEDELAKKPLRRKDVEAEARDFIKENLSKMLPALLYWEKSKIGGLVRQLGITNEQIGLLGAGFFIREEDGLSNIYQADEFYPNGRKIEWAYDPAESQDVSVGALVALAWAKDAIRTDTQNEVGGVESEISHRYFLRSKNRYLCANDFGMKVYDHSEGRMIKGSVNNVFPLIQTMSREFVRIIENLKTAFSQTIDQAETDISATMSAPDPETFPDMEEYREAVAMHSRETLIVANELAIRNILADFKKNPRNLELVLDAVPIRKAMSQVLFQSERIARKYGFIEKDAVRAYEKFNRSRKKKLRNILQNPSNEEKKGATIPYVHFDLFDKPIILDATFNTEEFVGLAERGVRDVLATRAAEADTKISEIFRRSQCDRGPQSPYFYRDYEVYDFIVATGAENAEATLSRDIRSISEDLVGFQFLRMLGYDFRSWEPSRIKKQLHEARKLERSRIWDYLGKRLEKEEDPDSIRHDIKTEGGHWLEHIETKKARDLFREGKRMYWLAQKIFFRGQREEDERFYYSDSLTDWSKYDLGLADVSPDALDRQLAKHGNLIVSLLEGDVSQDHYEDWMMQEGGGRGVSLGLLIKAMEKGRNLHGVGIAVDKVRYLQGVIEGDVEDDLAFAMEDWPEEWKQALGRDEIKIYYEYADDYAVLDSRGLEKYAQWRSSDGGRDVLDIFSGEISGKNEMDFRICLASQTVEVRRWYLNVAEYVGKEVVQDYLLRFNVTRGGNGRLANWHDVLFWVPNIQNLEAGEAKSIMLGIQTMDDNREFQQVLPRYVKSKDKLAENGLIQSLRELKKRVIAIESNIDFGDLPQAVIDIMTAPGFNLQALERLKMRANFQALVEGELDKEQPFRPHRRIFAGRDLVDALSEGLGSRKLKIKGTARSPRTLFSDLKKLVKGRTIGREKRKMQVTDLLEGIPPDLEEDIIELLRNQRVNTGPIIEAQVHAKSDPEGWVCGNYTDCCMPFGASNNEDYMFNRSTQYFTLKYNGRIVAQSVVIDGIDSKDGSDVVILDNIEVANNYQKFSGLFSRAYQMFWTEYTGKPVKVGAGYTDLIPPGGTLESNRYKPKSSLAYSDATGGQIYDMPKVRGVESADEIVTFANFMETDAQRVADLERKIYPEGLTHGKEYISDIIRKQREMEVPGATSSFMVRQGNETVGYLIMLPEQSDIHEGERVLHVYDMAILPEFQGKGLAHKMMERVLDIATAYGVAIEAEARASTSYPMLMNESVRRWFESKGFHLVKNESLSEYMGGEDFYFVRFENRQETD